MKIEMCERIASKAMVLFNYTRLVFIGGIEINTCKDSRRWKIQIPKSTHCSIRNGNR